MTGRNKLGGAAYNCSKRLASAVPVISSTTGVDHCGFGCPSGEGFPTSSPDLFSSVASSPILYSSLLLIGGSFIGSFIGSGRPCLTTLVTLFDRVVTLFDHPSVPQMFR